MMPGVSFLLFGFLAALAYLAYHHERDLIAFGLGGLALAAAFGGIELLIGPGDGTRAAFAMMMAILRFIAMGAGLAFLAFTGGVEGWRYFLAWRAKREAELDALRAGLRLDARKDAEPRSNVAR